MEQLATRTRICFSGAGQPARISASTTLSSGNSSRNTAIPFLRRARHLRWREALELIAYHPQGGYFENGAPPARKRPPPCRVRFRGWERFTSLAWAPIVPGAGAADRR